MPKLLSEYILKFLPSFLVAFKTIKIFFCENVSDLRQISMIISYQTRLCHDHGSDRCYDVVSQIMMLE